MDKKYYYVCWMSMNAGIQYGVFEIQGKVNSLSVMKAVNDTFYYRFDDRRVNYIIAFSESTPFDYDEESEFWKNYK